MKDFLKKIELYIGSIFISVTTIVVIMNVFTRYFLKFTYFWTEEIAVGCFVWTIFLGTAAAYREKGLIGVEAIVILLPEKIRDIVEFLTYILLTILSGLMCIVLQKLLLPWNFLMAILTLQLSLVLLL